MARASRTPTHLELRSRLIQRVEECYRHAEDTLGLTFNRPEITLNLRGGDAGQAISNSTETVLLRFNRIIYEDKPDEFLKTVVPHEIAHHVTRSLYGYEIKSHGEEWATIMQNVFKLPPIACHSFDTRRSKGRFYFYSCRCQEGKLYVNSAQHRLLIRGEKKLRCRKCHELLEYVHREDVKNGMPIHNLAIPGLFLAVDKGYTNYQGITHRLKYLLRGEKPASVFLLYPPSLVPALQVWLQRHNVLIEQEGGYDYLTDLAGHTPKISHAVALTAGHDRLILQVMQHWRASGVFSRMLRLDTVNTVNEGN